MKKLNITKEAFEKSKYFNNKYGKLEYVSESGKVFKTDKGKILMFKESSERMSYEDLLMKFEEIQDKIGEDSALDTEVYFTYDPLDEEQQEYIDKKGYTPFITWYSLQSAYGNNICWPSGAYEGSKHSKHMSASTVWELCRFFKKNLKKFSGYKVIGALSGYDKIKDIKLENGRVVVVFGKSNENDGVNESSKKFGKKFKESKQMNEGVFGDIGDSIDDGIRGIKKFFHKAKFKKGDKIMVCMADFTPPGVLHGLEVIDTKYGGWSGGWEYRTGTDDWGNPEWWPELRVALDTNPDGGYEKYDPEKFPEFKKMEKYIKKPSKESTKKFGKKFSKESMENGDKLKIEMLCKDLERNYDTLKYDEIEDELSGAGFQLDEYGGGLHGRPAYAVFVHPCGIVVNIEYLFVRTSPGKDSWRADDVTNFYWMDDPGYQRWSTESTKKFGKKFGKKFSKEGTESNPRFKCMEGKDEYSDDIREFRDDVVSALKKCYNDEYLVEPNMDGKSILVTSPYSGMDFKLDISVSDEVDM